MYLKDDIDRNKVITLDDYIVLNSTIIVSGEITFGGGLYATSNPYDGAIYPSFYLSLESDMLDQFPKIQNTSNVSYIDINDFDGNSPPEKLLELDVDSDTWKESKITVSEYAISCIGGKTTSYVIKYDNII